MFAVKPQVMVILMSGLVTFSAQCAGNSSAPVAVWTGVGDSLLWRTARQSPLTVSVDWPQGAASARLTARAGQSVVATGDVSDVSAKTFEFDIDAPAGESDERVLDLMIEYRDGSGTVLAGCTRTARVGLVRGANGRSARCVTRPASSTAWRRCGESVVLPVYADTGSVTLDGSPLDMAGAPGWAYAGPLAPGAHDLVLSDVAGGARTASVERVGRGMFLLVR